MLGAFILLSIFIAPWIGLLVTAEYARESESELQGFTFLEKIAKLPAASNIAM